MTFPPAPPFDLDHARSLFPALRHPEGWAFLDNAGGSLPPAPVIDRVAAHMRAGSVQLGASHAVSQAAQTAVDAGRRAAAALVGADPDEVVLGPSTTGNVARLASALRPTWDVGDEVVVTDLDHEANIGAWRRLEATGIAIRTWAMRPETASLHPEDLVPLLGPRTRLVCFTHCANVVGNLHDVAGVTKLVHDAGARVCVDGVAFAPHRRVDVRALDVDWYLVSLYKVYGPHVGLLYGKRALLGEARSQNHYFYGEDHIPQKLEPGGVPHELVAGLPGTLDYLDAVHDRLPDAGPAPAGSSAERLERVFAAFAEWESQLAARLLGFLRGRPGVRILGRPDPDAAGRVPTVAFTVDGVHASAIPPVVDRHRVAIRFGHFYAARAVDALGLADRGGVVRVSAVHYNTLDEVDRLCSALDEALPG